MSEDNLYELPDGSGCFTASMPLPRNHWIYHPTGKPPTPWLMGTDHPRRHGMNRQVEEAARYAIKAATRSGTENDFDPDALVQNLIVGLLGYHTPDGTDKTSNVHPVTDDTANGD